MIVRILGEGQWELGPAELAEVEKLDEELAAAVTAADEEAFARTLRAVLDTVRTGGTPVPHDRLVPSELVLPSADAGLAEVHALLAEEGLISG